jgi:hypothetical protein
MLLEVREVGRKTPADGRLEVTESTYRRLLMVGASLTVRVGAARAQASLERMPCTCGKAPGGAHEHAFVRSELLRGLQPGRTCVLELGDAGELLVESPHSLEP